MLKSVLAVSQGGPDAAMSFGLAARVAGVFEAAVDALHLSPGQAAVLAPEGEMLPVFLDRDIDDGARAGESEAQFGKRLRGLAGATYAVAEGSTLDDLVGRGRCADLVVIGRPGSDPDNAEPVTVTTAIHDCARPVMIAPPQPGQGGFDRVVVAWNGSLQAARAVGYALPFLARAKSATIVVIGRAPEAVGAPRLVRSLARHGIEAAVESIDPGAVSARARGRALLAYAHDKPADLLVMGAYGRGQVLSFLGLGGATAKVISSSRVPLLVAH